MLSSHRTSRRHHPDDDDELPLTVTRIDDHRSDAYPHAHHHSSRSEVYIASSSAARASYREPESSSRAYRSDDWRTRDSAAYPSSTHDRYHENAYSHHPRREEYYERAESRHAEQWPSRTEHYSSSTRDWQKHGEHEYVSASYSESRRNWPSSSRYEDAGSAYDHWAHEPARREPERARYEREEDYVAPPEGQGWRRDSGWRDDDHKSSAWVEPVDERHITVTSASQDQRTVEERAWEPAPSWKSREGDEGSHSQRSEHQYSRSYKKAGKSGKRNHGGKKVDRRKDDSHMNK